jgi:hypothetical protein
MTTLEKLQNMIATHKPDGISTRVKHDSEIMQSINDWPTSAMCSSLIEKIYCYAQQRTEIPRCTCGSPVKFVSITYGYREFCSRSCDHAKAAATTRRVATMIAQGGVGLANPKSKLKAQTTLQQKHGVTNGFCLPQVVDKRTANNPMQNPSIVEAMRQKCFEEHGVNWHSKRPDVIHKRTQTTLTKYGVTNCAQKNYSNGTLKVLQDPGQLKHLFQTSTVQEMGENLGVCETTILKYLKLYGIRQPNEITPEVQLQTWLTKQGFCDFHKTRSVLTTKQEIDLYSPTQNLGIEYCGLYWHSQAHKNRSYHRNKYETCANQGIKLITIFEDEWLNKQDVVLSRLSQLLGVNNRVIGSRKLTICEIDRSQCETFLNMHHTSGSAPASVNIGAYDGSNLVAAMTFSRGRRFNKPKHDWEWEMIRFSTDGGHYPGVASRLFKYFVKAYDPSSVLSYADLRWGSGGYLAHLGFVRYDDTPPNYWYFSLSNADFRRYHRFTFNKQSLLKKFPGSDPNLSEYELAKKAGLERIWDCGNASWIWRS